MTFLGVRCLLRLQTCGQKLAWLEGTAVPVQLLLPHHWSRLNHNRPASTGTTHQMALSQRSYSHRNKLTNFVDCDWKYFMQPRRYAGHNKWSNIKSTKMSKDQQKQRKVLMILQDVKRAVKEGGGINPDFNSALRRVIDRAQAHNVPKTTLMNSLKAAEKSAKEGRQYVVECRGPFGGMMMVEYFTHRTKFCSSKLNALLKKYGGTSQNVAGAKMSFEHKAILETKTAEGVSEISLDKAEEIAIEIGAEDISLTTDDIEEDKTIYRFVCSVTDLPAVKKGLPEHGLEEVDSHLGYVPISFADVPKDGVDLVSTMMDKIEDLEDLVRTYDNYKLPAS